MGECRFDDRVAVITGAGRGLGRAYAELLASKGAKIVVNDPGTNLAGDDFDTSPAEEVVRKIQSAGGEAVVCTESVATPEGGRTIVESALDRYGRIDILIHNAGIVRPAPMTEMSQEDFDRVVDVHFRGAFHVVRPAFPRMCEAGYGRIVLASSIGGIYGNYRQANYAMVKSGMIGLNNVVGLEGAAHDVKCNIVLPGAMTRMVAFIDASGYPELKEDMVAPVVGWLCHESCSVTAEMYIAVGGRMARAMIAETRGVFRPEWTIDDVGRNIDAIRDAGEPVIFPVVPSAHVDHMDLSFEMIREGLAAAEPE